jgi:hypothetical protein
MGNNTILIGNNPETSMIIVVNPILMKFITAEPCAVSEIWLIAKDDAFETIKHLPKLIIIIGINNVNRTVKCINIVIIMTIVPVIITKIPNRIIFMKEWRLTNFAEIMDPNINPIADKTVPMPYCLLFMPKILIATNGATAENT